MHLRRGIIYRDSAGLLLLLLFGIVGGEIGRNALPRLTVITRTEEELRADIDSSFFIRTHVYRRIPIEVQLLLAVVRKRLDRPGFVGVAVDTANFSSLRLRV